MTNTRCRYCSKRVEPESRSTYRRVQGWERKAHPASSRRGGSDIVLREHVAEYACPACVDLLKAGLNPAQEALL